jgi:hypothetical protein
MAYIARSSGRNEILLHRARLALLYPTAGWSALIAFLSMTAAAYAYELRWLAAVAALAGLALFLVFMVPVWSTEIGLTNQRFILGLLRWSSDELQLNAEEEVRLEQGLLGRLLNYGRIEVRGTGVATIRLPSSRLRCARRFSTPWTGVTDQAPPDRRMSPSPMTLSSSVCYREGDLR